MTAETNNSFGRVIRRVAPMMLPLTLVGGCTTVEVHTGQNAPTPAVETMGSAAVRATITHTESHAGKTIGTYTYQSPNRRDRAGSYAEGEAVWAACSTEGREGIDPDVPGEKPLTWTTWVLTSRAVEGAGAAWTPQPFVELQPPTATLPPCTPTQVATGHF